ncbi:MAG: glycosyltransferase 87 family protein [Candidatus Pacebacteria bacterium]|nr:glycosyltransferase 87 family protein [Candidatus Paceibacterota bacterium]
MIKRLFNSSAPVQFLVWMALVYCLLLPFLYLDWGRGIARGVILIILITLILGLKLFYEIKGFKFIARHPNPVKNHKSIIIIFAIVALGMAGQFAWDLRHNRISLDQGPITANAVRLLQMGKNPYDSNHMVDTTAWLRDLPARQAAGYGPDDSITPENYESALQNFTDGHNATLSQHLLPKGLPPMDWVPPWQGKELAGLGYKYGPMILVSSLPAVAIFGVAGITLLNCVAVLASLMVLWRIARHYCDDSRLVTLAILALALDPFVRMNFIQRSATDIYPILFIALAVLAWLQQGRKRVGLFLALALGCKTAPTIVVLPLLLTVGWQGILVFALSTVVIFAPWLWWNGAEFIRNELLWGVLTQADSTAWRFFASPLTGQIITLFLALAMAVIWINFLWIQRDRAKQRLSIIPLIILQSLLLVAGGNMFHNNYVPWFSLWLPILGLVWLSSPKSFLSENPESRPSQAPQSQP